MKGLVHIYTGNGKGKTSAAVGLGIRAYGRGFKVLMVQFMKSRETGELITLGKLPSGFEIRRGKEMTKFSWEMDEKEISDMKQAMKELFDKTVESVSNGEFDMLIMDELVGTVSIGLIEAKDVIEFINVKPEKLEIVMTGRNAPKELIDVVDYVSEINAVKHPFKKGIEARKGIEY